MDDTSRDYQPQAPHVIDAWDALPSEERAQYFFSQGFVVSEKPPCNPRYPYLLLTAGYDEHRTNGYDVHEASLYLEPSIARHCLEHPSQGRDVAALADTLAMHLTSAGTSAPCDILNSPLSIYVIDPAWNSVVACFVEKYGKPTTEDVVLNK